MRLTAAAVRNAKPRDREYKLSDGRGLSLSIAPNGSKYWRYRYRFDGKAKQLSLGPYPEFSLAEAREKLEEKRKLVAKGVDPSAERKARKSARRLAAANSFEVVALEFIAKQTWVASHAERNKRRLELYVFPRLGRRPISEIEPPDLLEALQSIEADGKLETVKRVRALCSQIFRYAIATLRCQRDPAADLVGAFAATPEKHHASIVDPKQIGPLMQAIEGYSGQPVTRLALKLLALTFVRPGELRHAEWSEFDPERNEWRIPAKKMKMREPHIVPLSKQALAVVEELRPHTGHRNYLFPSLRTSDRPISENTLNAALRRMGYSKDEMTSHGFRSMASTILNEQRVWHPDVIERQLAHSERNKVRAAYNFAEHIEERARMMQWWGDFLQG